MTHPSWSLINEAWPYGVNLNRFALWPSTFVSRSHGNQPWLAAGRSVGL